MTDTFARNEVQPLRVWIESKWNDKIENVYSEVKIMDIHGNQIDLLKTPTEDLAP